MRILATIMVLVVLCAANCMAGWITNAWPAYEHWRDYGVCESNLVDQVNARGTLCGGSVSRSWWRTRSGNLASIKSTMKSMVPGWESDEWGYRWVRMDAVTNPVYWLTASNALPVYTSTAQVLRECGLPTNFFDYTPWRDLSGIGGFTNDLTVGRPHGMTNQYTAAGGTNFPAGRSRWYTTDYGIDGCKAFLDRLTTINPYHGAYTRIASLGYSGSGSTVGDLEAAKAAARANYQYVGAGYPCAAAGLYHEGVLYSAALKAGLGLMVCGDMQPAITNFSISPRAFFECEPAGSAVFGYVVDAGFDDQGSGYDEGWNEIANAWFTNGTAKQVLAWVGTTNAPVSWPVATNEWTSSGWMGLGDYCSMVTIQF